MKKKRITLLIALAYYILSFNVYAQDANNPYVHCLVLDKTMSMTGHGGTDIWADVQNYCYEWIDGVPQSSIVLFFTFDRDLYGPQKFEINSDADKAKIKNAVRNVKVDGRHTWISSNLDKTIEYLNKNYPSSQYNRRIYLITDGKEEQLEANFSNVLRHYDSKRGDFDYLYYVDLRDMAPEDVKKDLENTPGSGYGSGFPKFLTISPVVKTVNLLLGGSKSFEQHFIISNDERFSQMSFDIKIDSIRKVGESNVVPNVTLTPSRNISQRNMTKLEDGKYKATFTVDFINESMSECDIYVGLVGRNQGSNVITFEPAGFVIKARNKPAPPKPTVKTKNGLGWH